MREQVRERGAAAVEFALVVPLLIALVLGIAAFGRAYNIQSSLSMSAREGARVMALYSPPSGANSKAGETATSAAMGLIGVTDPSLITTSTTPATCAPDLRAVTTVSYTFDLFGFGGFLGVPETIKLTGRAVMQCSG